MISVCVATYNGEKYIRQQLNSIRMQLGEDDEIVVSDDMSCDGTVSIIEGMNDSRIRIFKHENKYARFKIDYATHNFENALNHVKGDIVFLSDQDDVWLPNKVEVMMAALRHSDVVMSDCYVTDKDLNVVSSSYYKTNRVFRPSIFYNFLKPSFLGSCMAFRRDVLDKVLPFPKYGVGHDLWIGLVGLRCCRFRFLDEPLIYYRRHQFSVTDGGKDNKTSLWFKIRYRVYVFLSLGRLFMKK